MSHPFEDLNIPEGLDAEALEDPAVQVFKQEFLPVWRWYFPTEEQAWHAFWFCYLQGYSRGTPSQPEQHLCRRLLVEQREEMAE